MYLFCKKTYYFPLCLAQFSATMSSFMGIIIIHAFLFHRMIISLELIAPQVMSFVHSFVRSLWAGVQPTLDSSDETFLIGSVRQPREKMGFDRHVWCKRYVG